MAYFSSRSHLILLLSCALLLTASGCAGNKFKKAKATDSVRAYDIFLSQYGDSKYALEARRLRETSFYRHARYLGTTSAYQEFLREYPTGRYANEARKEIERIKAEIELEEAIATRVRDSRSAIDQAVILSYASGSLEARLRSNRYLKPYFEVFDRLLLTKRDIVVTRERSDCSDIPLLGTLCTNYLYAGKILKNDIVYFDQKGRIRTIHQEKNLLRFYRDSGDYELSGWIDLIGEEAFGETRYFKNEKRLSDSDLFHRNYRVKIAESFYPTRFSSKSTSADGGILGFIQDHPVMSLIIGAAVVSMLDDNKGTSTSSSSSTSTARPSSSSGGFSKLLSCASQSIAGKLIENPAAAGAISEAIRAGLEDDKYSLRGASKEAAKNYIIGHLRSEGNEEAANIAEAGDFLMCAIGALN